MTIIEKMYCIFRRTLAIVRIQDVERVNHLKVSNTRLMKVASLALSVRRDPLCGSDSKMRQVAVKTLYRV